MPIPQPGAGLSSRVRSLAMQRTIAIICAEHRSLREVLQMMRRTVLDMLGKQVPHDCAALKLMLQYIRQFPESLHHPKEDLYLFAKLRRRTGELDAVMAELGRQHAGGAELLDRMERALTRFERGFPPAFEEFSVALDAYCERQCRHMQLEESIILPAAAEHLSREDWEEIAAAFRSNGDPRFSAEREKPCLTLYGRISRAGSAAAGSM
jgi:hemerythrin-like domain-containing protein